MKWLGDIPGWLATALIGAVFAVAGYVGKALVDWRQARRKERAATIAQLQRLQALLNAAWEVFKIQDKQVTILRGKLTKEHPTESADADDEVMSRCFAAMTSEQKELHSIIRAYTEYSLRKVNQSISDWLSADVTFKTGIAPSSRRRELAEELFALEVHLLLWHAKYESWIPNHPEHALVYLDDEKKHGLGFPKKREVRVGSELITKLGVDAEVVRVLKELQEKWK